MSYIAAGAARAPRARAMTSVGNSPLNGWVIKFYGNRKIVSSKSDNYLINFMLRRRARDVNLRVKKHRFVFVQVIAVSFCKHVRKKYFYLTPAIFPLVTRLHAYLINQEMPSTGALYVRSFEFAAAKKLELFLQKRAHNLNIERRINLHSKSNI